MTLAQSASFSSARPIASTWPRSLRTLSNSCVLSLIACVTPYPFADTYVLGLGAFRNGLLLVLFGALGLAAVLIGRVGVTGPSLRSGATSPERSSRTSA
jgi:hypothetical protein